MNDLPREMQIKRLFRAFGRKGLSDQFTMYIELLKDFDDPTVRFGVDAAISDAKKLPLPAELRAICTDVASPGFPDCDNCCGRGYFKTAESPSCKHGLPHLSFGKYMRCFCSSGIKAPSPPLITSDEVKTHSFAHLLACACFRHSEDRKWPAKWFNSEKQSEWLEIAKGAIGIKHILTAEDRIFSSDKALVLEDPIKLVKEALKGKA